jgi:hypothetical protein
MSATLKPVNKAIYCNDGFSMSVQASARSQCKPRTNWGPYTEMEVAFPSTKEPLLLPFCDSPSMSPDVFANVPVEVINQIIAKHGGILIGRLPHTLITEVAS